ncbi:MAG: hypothetical protein ACOX1N_01705 [Candidatus Methanomethylophilaceae archaeon]|jgi:hypothetical protein
MPMEKLIEQEEGMDSLIERVGLYIPIYRGYKEQNLRRDEDRAIRQELVLTLEGAEENMKVISEASAESTDIAADVDRISEKINVFLESVAENVNGYSGWHASADSLEKEMEELVSLDSKLIEDTVLLRGTVANLVQKIDLGEYAIMTPLKEIEKILDRLIEDYDGRETVMKKFLKEV